jgi:NAD(P)-dependent dehydrogenase (short-subunit alcohol dehydrogenase family)
MFAGPTTLRPPCTGVAGSRACAIGAAASLGRLGTPQDIATLGTLLVSPLGSFTTGTTIQVDDSSRRSLL